MQHYMYPTSHFNWAMCNVSMPKQYWTGLWNLGHSRWSQHHSVVDKGLTISAFHPSKTEPLSGGHFTTAHKQFWKDIRISQQQSDSVMSQPLVLAPVASKQRMFGK